MQLPEDLGPLISGKGVDGPDEGEGESESESDEMR